VLHYPGDYNVAVPGHRDIGYRDEVLERQGVDVQVLSFTTPGTHVETPERAVELAQLVNDAFSRIVVEGRGRFAALATLPLNQPADSARELTRAVLELGLRGAMLFSNVNGVSLADDRFQPLYEAADRLRTVLYIHPTHPLGVEAMTDYWLMPLVGFPMDTTLAAAHLVFRGIPERFPHISWVLGHLGGAIPYLAERLDRGFRAFAECRRHIARPPSEYLRAFYLDTVNFDPRSLKLAVEFAGVERVMAGSDYPHMIGSLTAMREAIRSLPMLESEKALVMGGNAERLFGLPASRARG
jgi:aminocarboxymuconate-semialdehyde decarboxylase